MAAGRGGKRQSYVNNSDDPRHRNLLASDLLALLSTVTTDTSAFLTQNDLNLLPSQTLALEPLITSTYKSLALLGSTTTSIHQPHTDCWFHRFITQLTSDTDARWTDSFRMSKRSFTLLLQLLTPSLQSAFQSLPPNYILGAAIYRLAHGADYASVGRRFAMDSAEACRAFFVVCKSVHQKLGNLFEFESDMNRIRLGFNWMGLPNCCGVLGMERFGVGGKLFGENGAVMVQAVVDSEGRFVDVSAGWPSSMEVGTILRQTKLYAGAEERGLLDGLFEQGFYRQSEGFSLSQYLLGESCFPLLPWLLTPYVRNNEDDGFSLKEKAFNAAHARGMELLRTAFARVKGRWRLLARQWNQESIEFLPYVIVTGCLLHNFLIKSNEYFPDEENVVHCAKEEAVSEGEEIERAQRIRDTLASHLSRVSMST